jgi:hypothetical protein
MSVFRDRSIILHKNAFKKRMGVFKKYSLVSTLEDGLKSAKMLAVEDEDEGAYLSM